MLGFIRELKESMQRRGLTALPRLGKRNRHDRGALLIETVVAVLVFSLVGTAVLSGLSTTHISGAKTERQSVAENIVRNQLEHMFSRPYQEPPSSYPTITVPEGYGVTCTAEEYVLGDPDVEKVVVTVTFNGREVLVLETLRSK